MKGLSLTKVSLASALIASSLLSAGCDRGGNFPSEPQASAASNQSAVRRSALTQAPTLAGSGAAAQQSAKAFIDWAGNSLPSDREQARSAISAASTNSEIAQAVGEEALKTYQSDNSRALIALSILGEMRSPAGTEYLKQFVKMPLPQNGTVVEGEILEQTAIASLQAKAIDGLAYLKSAEGDQEVLRAVKEHPSRIVRAEAIDAYLWNHGDSPQARETLRQYVRAGEEIFLDRIRREEGESHEAFDEKLAKYLEAHPEFVPPAPTKVSAGSVKHGQDEVTPVDPPALNVH